MPQGFYELLGLRPDASPAEVESAYQKELAALVRRMRHARQQGADVSILEGQETVLREARAVLGDALRRRRYDAFRRASDQGLPGDLESLWAQAADALVDPVAVASLRVVRTLTDMPVGEPFPGVASPVPAGAPASSPTASSPTASSPNAPPPVRMPRPGTAPDSAGQDAAAPGPDAQDSAGGGARISLPRPAAGLADTDPGHPVGQPRADGGMRDTSPGSAFVEVVGGPTSYDPLEQLLGDLHGTDPGLSTQAPADPVDALARDFGYDGRFLAGVRELRGLTLDDLSRSTRISTRYLEALEDNGYDQLPAATFVRGYLKEVVRVLDLGERDVVGGYMALFQRARG